MPVGMQTSSGNAGAINQNNQSSQDAGIMAKMKSFFSGKEAGGQEVNQADPWAVEEASAAEAASKVKAPELNDYNELFTPKVDPNKPVERKDPFASVTRENLASAANNMDFAATVDEATMTAALGGDSTAMRTAINVASRAAFAEAMSASNVLMQKRIDDVVNTKVNDLVKTRLADFEIDKAVSSNPLLSNPATKPMRDMLTQQIKISNPGITAESLNTQLTGYLTAFANSVNPNSGKPEAGKVDRLGKAKESAFDF
jgi:hypothetical protein